METTENTSGSITKDTHLNLCPQNYVRISGICETKDATKLVHSEVSNIANLEFWWLRRPVSDHLYILQDLSKAQTWVPISSSTTSILSAMTGGLFPLLSAASTS